MGACTALSRSGQRCLEDLQGSEHPRRRDPVAAETAHTSV